MTDRKAIKRLREHTQYYVPVEDLSALELAIDALQEREERRNGCYAIEKEDALMHCSMCDRIVNPHIDYFCRGCGRPLKGSRQ